MNVVFSKIAAGVKWVGKEIGIVSTWVPRILRITKDVEGDAGSLLPQAVTVFEDVEAVGVAVVKDSGASLAAGEALVQAIVLAAAAKGVNIAEDAAVVGAFETFIQDVTSKSTWPDFFAAIKKLVVDYDTLGASAKAALAKLEADAKS